MLIVVILCSHCVANVGPEETVTRDRDEGRKRAAGQKGVHRPVALGQQKSFQRNDLSRFVPLPAGADLGRWDSVIERDWGADV